MKKVYLFLAIMILGILQSCNPTEEPLMDSNLDITTPELNTTDTWLRNNFVTPYNIDVSYRWNEGIVDLDRYLHPPKLENVIPIMKAVKTIWLDTYSEVGGEDFVKKIAPRELVLIGGVNLNESGTRTLGFAEGGKNIILFETDLIDLGNRFRLTRFMKTIQHEYAHILNQTVRFNEEAYKQITPSDYTAQWFNPFNRQDRFDIANELGFITDYARASYFEDFAEMVSILLINSATEYNQIISNIHATVIRNDVIDALGEALDKAVETLGDNPTQAEITATTDTFYADAVAITLIVNAATVISTPKADKAVSLIREKEAIVADYYKKEFNIDIYELQKVAAHNISVILNNN